ncbi:hypothetical protein J1N35_007285 [Gossypium stocksii]|uniref:Uncharacterized protein n=1 Tax=Gossypium stocksii TaxID=47602 RepID=A0A9D4ADB9_9ROSI|nr:hypothetical protein J1N35_007285 [Gossypium stocksii]
MVVTGDGELGFDSGEGASETATTSKEGNRRANYPILTWGELADAYSPDTVIASSLGKEVHDLWAFYLHEALLSQAFAHCGKFPTAASRRSLGHVSVPVWLIIAMGISSRFQLLFPSQGQVLTRYSPVCHWKHHFLSDLHVLSMPPVFILSQDQTLHEIYSCITYSFLVRRQSRFRIVFHSKA